MELTKEEFKERINEIYSAFSNTLGVYLQLINDSFIRHYTEKQKEILGEITRNFLKDLATYDFGLPKAEELQQEIDLAISRQCFELAASLKKELDVLNNLNNEPQEL